MKHLLCADTSTAGRLLLALLTPEGTLPKTLAIDGLEEELIPQVSALLSEGGLSLGSLDGFVIGSGPGSFMGLRLGYAALKAWAWAGKKPLGQVSSLAVFGCSYRGLCAPTVDGKMGKVFCALFEGGTRLQPDADLSPEAFRQGLAPFPGAKILGFLGKGEQASAEGLAKAALSLAPESFICGDALAAAEPAYLRLSAAEETLRQGQN